MTIRTQMEAILESLEEGAKLSAILSQFHGRRVELRKLKDFMPDAFQHAVALGWITVRGRYAELTDEGKREQARQAAR